MTAPVVNVAKCAVCGSGNVRSVLQLPIADFIGSGHVSYDLGSLGLTGGEPMGYARCRACSFIFASPTTDGILEDATYNGAKAAQAADKAELWADPDANGLYQTHHKWVDFNPFIMALGFHFKRFSKPRNPGEQQLRLLDVGCGFGHTLELARVFGVQETGCDIDHARLAVCREKGLNVMKPDAVAGTFDIVVSCNVIEHVYDLQSYIRMIATHLEKDGIFVFSGLEKDIIQVELKRRRFKLLHPIEHRNVLTRGALNKLLGAHGLRLVTRAELFATMKQVRSKAPLYLPYLVTGGFFAVNGVFSAFAKHA
jgi:2-polyprenyl-3-methyl-5-hydroxy-6-metoxy-1,4-benzoquinol methylase